jgi:hypothetical protein
MQRPIGVTITAILMVANIFADIVLSFYSPSVVVPDAHPVGTMFSPVMLAVHVGLVVFIALQCMAVLYYWLGRYWARWVILTGCVYYLTGLRYLPRQLHQAPYTGAALTIASVFLALYLIWYLHTAVGRAWFARPQADNAIEK